MEANGGTNKMLWHIGLVFMGMFIAGVIIMLNEAMKETNQRSAVNAIFAAIIIIISALSGIIVFITTSNADIDVSDLEFDEVYHIGHMESIPNNDGQVGLFVTKFDISENVSKAPIILAIVNKDLIASNVQPGKYIIKNNLGKIEAWTPPNT